MSTAHYARSCHGTDEPGRRASFDSAETHFLTAHNAMCGHLRTRMPTFSQRLAEACGGARALTGWTRV
eukprot:2412703-Pleurochrysis_carterae.AAC.2